MASFDKRFEAHPQEGLRVRFLLPADNRATPAAAGEPG